MASVDPAIVDPAIVDMREITPPAGRGIVGWLLPRWRHIPDSGATGQ